MLTEVAEVGIDNVLDDDLLNDDCILTEVTEVGVDKVFTDKVEKMLLLETYVDSDELGLSA